MLSHQVKTLDQRVREYLNAEARKMIPPNVNVHVCKSANHSIQTDCENRVNNEQATRVLPYAGGTQFVTCAPNNSCNVLHRKKISASDNVINCREGQLSSVYSVRAAGARPPEFRSDKQLNRSATAVAPPHVFVRGRLNAVAENRFAETPRSSGDVRSNFNEVAGIKPVVTQRYCGELVSKNRCGELRQKPHYPFVAPSSVVDKQLRVCRQRRQRREMRESFSPACYHHDIAVPSAVLHSPNCVDNTDQFASQSSEVKRGVGRAESAPFVNNADCAVASQTLKPKSGCSKTFSDASEKYRNVKQPPGDLNISPEREAHEVLAPKSDNVNKAGNMRGLLLDVGFPAPVVNVVSSCEPENVVSPDVGSPSCSEVQN